MNDISKSKFLKVCEKCNNRCHYCGFNFEKIENHAQSKSIDHLTSRNRGGKNNITNLVLACKSCNSKKGKMCEIDFIRYQEFKKSKRYLDFLQEEIYIKDTIKSIKNGTYKE